MSQKVTPQIPNYLFAIELAAEDSFYIVVGIELLGQFQPNSVNNIDALANYKLIKCGIMPFCKHVVAKVMLVPCSVNFKVETGQCSSRGGDN